MTYSISPGWPPIHPCPWPVFSVARCNPPTSALRRLQSLRDDDDDDDDDGRSSIEWWGRVLRSRG